MNNVRMSPQTLLLLTALVNTAEEWRYGYDLSEETELKSGTMYPILMRLAQSGWLKTRWEEPKTPGKPPRHMYRLTSQGQKWARQELRTRQQGKRSTRPAYSEG